MNIPGVYISHRLGQKVYSSQKPQARRAGHRRVPRPKSKSHLAGVLCNCKIMGVRTKLLKALFVVILAALLNPGTVFGYDPNDPKIAECCLPPEGMFEAFYPREVEGIPNSASRPAHGHGSFFKHRNPALVDTKNAAAYGYRFDGKRRFNFD